jgi:maltoporin
MFKATVAQLFQAGKGVWARPSFRIFATYSDSNTEWDRSGTTYGKAMHSGTGNVEEVTFGFNVETWW